MPDRTIRSRFSASSSTYDRHSNIQDRVADRVMEMIGGDPCHDRILELGCGTGRLTKKLRSRFADSKVTAVDLSDAMVRQARINLQDCEDIDWIVADVCDFTAERLFPMVVSSSALHWISPIDRALDVIDRSVEPSGPIVLAIMLHDTLGELHDARLRIAPHKPPQSRLPTMPEVLDASQRLGWRTLYQSESLLRVNYDSSRDLLAAIHQQGLTGGSVSRSHTPLTRGELSSLMKDYELNYRNDSGMVVASYQVGFLHCCKS